MPNEFIYFYGEKKMGSVLFLAFEMRSALSPRVAAKSRLWLRYPVEKINKYARLEEIIPSAIGWYTNST